VQQSLCLGCWVFKRVLAPEKERATKKRKRREEKKNEGNRAIVFLHSLLSWCEITFAFSLTSLA
jgi:hypothetical protein